MSRPPSNPADSPPPPGGTHPGQDGADASGKVRPPRAAVLIAVVVAAEATALLAAAAWYAFELVSGSPVLSFWGAVFTLGILLAFSAWLYAVGHFLYRGFRWTRAAALVAQLFVLTIGFPTLTSGLVLAGLAMVVPAVAALVLLFHNSVIAYASRTGGAPPAL